jgi:hypothetical protein
MLSLATVASIAVKPAAAFGPEAVFGPDAISLAVGASKQPPPAFLFDSRGAGPVLRSPDAEWLAAQEAARPTGSVPSAADPHPGWAKNASWYALGLAAVAAASTRTSSTDSSELKSSATKQSKILRASDRFAAPKGMHGRVVRSLEQLYNGGGFPPFGSDDGDGGGDGDGEKFKLIDAPAYCNVLDSFANGAAVRSSELLARHSAEEYIECLEKEHERTIKMQEDDQRVQLEKACGSWEGGHVPEVAFIAMRQEEEKRKVTALFSIEQSMSGNSRNWIVRFTTGDPRAIAPRLPDSEDPWTDRYKLYSWLFNRQMRLFIEQRYHQRDFWYFRKSEGFDL